MINKKVDEAVFDVLLEQAFSDVIEEDIKKLQEETEPCTISAETEQKIKKLIAQAGKRENRKSTKIIIRAASIILVVLLNVSLIGLLLVPSVNAEVKNVFADLFDKYVSYENKEQDSYVVTTSEYEIGYVPKGFEVIILEDDLVKFREINQGNGYISINFSNESFSRLSVDSDSETSLIIRIHEAEAYMDYEDGNFSLYWYDGYHFISIFGNITEDDLIKVAENIKKSNKVQYFVE